MREDKVSIVRACRIVELDRSMFYYQSVQDDSEVELKLNGYLENKLLCNRGCPEYYKRLRREGFPWNHKRVERIYRNMGLSKRRKKKRRIPNPERRPLIVPDTMNDTWSMDLVEDRRENGRKIRTLNIIGREGMLDAYILSIIHQAREETFGWMEDYNNNHPHDSLGDKTPAESPEEIF